MNFSTVFLGQNDALFVDSRLLVDVANRAYQGLSLEDSRMGTSRLLMFANPLALVKKEMSDFARIDTTPFEKIHINMGVESLDPSTLRALGRPFGPVLAWKALERVKEIHANTRKIEISINFVLGPRLDKHHMDLMVRYLEECEYSGKGYVFVSPLLGAYRGPGQVKREVFYLKARSRIPLFLYGLVGLV